MPFTMPSFAYLVLIFYLFPLTLFASNTVTPSLAMKNQLKFALAKIEHNISPSEDARGAVIAAQTRERPNYYYHWVRDAGISMEALFNLYERVNDRSVRVQISHLAEDYLTFSTAIQNVKTLTGLGEPKFNVNGSAYNDPWARPQNDSPALRAISLIHWAEIQLHEGNIDFVKTKMYSAELPAQSPIKKDLEYLSHHWQDPSYDLWEEIKGRHFYTLMVIRRALLDGAQLAQQLNDPNAATWYHEQGKKIESVIQTFWEPKLGYLVATRDYQDGINYKTSNLDSSVLLGLLHGDRQDGFLAWDDERIIATMAKITDTFKQLYPINKRAKVPGIAIGRYPEDRYAGDNFNGGNPWPLCTFAVAESYYRLSALYTRHGMIQKALKARLAGDQYVARVNYHANADGSLNEQINRETGYMTSVADLTWNYAAIMTTWFAKYHPQPQSFGNQ